jgi:hypothetical protein
LDGKPVPAVLLNVERLIDIGAHEVTATAPGFHSVTKSVTLVERGSVTLDLDLDEIAAEPARPAPELATTQSAAEQPSPQRATRQRTWGWTFMGVAGAGLATSAITGVIALNKKSDLDKCPATGCPPSSEQDIDTFRTMRTVSYVSLAVGVASLGVGSYFLLSGSRESAHVAASIGPASAAIQGAF